MKYGDNIYYTNEMDEVIKFNERKMKIDENYKYITTNPFLKLLSWFSYYFFALPYAFVVFKLFKRIKFHNLKIFKKHKSNGCFVYANHTNQYCDGFCPPLICFPKKPHFIVNPANVSIPIVGKLTKMWGALPIPNNIQATKNFYQAIEYTLKKNNPIIIYPEAHLWPYHTKIRNFPNTSFRYPIKYTNPVFTFTTIYKLKKIGKKPKIEIYVDGPFYPNKDLNFKDAQQELWNVVYAKLSERAKLSNYEYVNYIHQEKIND